ncbi:GSCOCG00008399001-RA-CDS [Cotesia congregata]|nr:GSCOCG00008399001-RA-CDS [Cotesia congregata]
MTPWLVAVFCLATAGCLNVTDQQTSESQNEQVAILKQLRKVNDDGSYTFGYEAGDGSFKVETRDVLGNVKGTFGFVDGDGEIKRVTYSSSNGTGFKATTISPLQERPSVVQAIPRSNRSSSSTRRPSSMSTSTESSMSSTLSTSSSSTSSTINSKLNLGPSILRRAKTTPMPSSSSNSTTTESAPKTTFGTYLKSTKRPRLFSNQHRPSPEPESSEQESDNLEEDSQITRPTVEAKAATQRKSYFTKRPLDHTLRPITEEFEEKEEESKSPVSGNNLRRQLQDETTIKVRESQESSDEHSDVYHAGTLSTPRPLFTTTNNPKIIQRVRMERPKLFYHPNNHQQQVKSSADENYGPAQFDDNKYQSQRNYEAENKVAEQEREAPEQFVYRVPQARLSPRDYVRPMDPTYIRRQQILRDLPPGLFVQPQDGEEEYQPPVERILARLQARAYPRPDPENVDYISEAPAMEVQPQAPPPPPVPAPATVNHQNYIPRQFVRLIRPYMDHEPRPRGYMRLQDEKDYMDGYHRNVVLPPEPPNPIAPPLSRRDFQLLLRRLLVSQYGTQALSHPRSYLDHALYDEQAYYQRPRLMYEEPIPAPRARLMPAIDPLYNPYYQDPNQNYQDPRYARRVYRQKFYEQDINESDGNNHGDEILPPPVREALLLRMLQLAINNQRAMAPNAILMSPTPSSQMTPVTTSGYRKSGPVRSVQIISDDKSEDKDDRKKL